MASSGEEGLLSFLFYVIIGEHRPLSPPPCRAMHTCTPPSAAVFDVPTGSPSRPPVSPPPRSLPPAALTRRPRAARSVPRDLVGPQEVPRKQGALLRHRLPWNHRRRQDGEWATGTTAAAAATATTSNEQRRRAASDAANEGSGAASRIKHPFRRGAAGRTTFTSPSAHPLSTHHPRSQYVEVQEKGPNFYNILGVTRGSNPLEVKRAYKRRSLELHPDKNPSPNAVEEFDRLKSAYDVSWAARDRLGVGCRWLPPGRRRACRRQPTRSTRRLTTIAAANATAAAANATTTLSPPPPSPSPSPPRQRRCRFRFRSQVLISQDQRPMYDKFGEEEIKMNRIRNEVRPSSIVNRPSSTVHVYVLRY